MEYSTGFLEDIVNAYEFSKSNVFYAIGPVNQDNVTYLIPTNKELPYGYIIKGVVNISREKPWYKKIFKKPVEYFNRILKYKKAQKINKNLKYVINKEKLPEIVQININSKNIKNIEDVISKYGNIATYDRPFGDYGLLKDVAIAPMDSKESYYKSLFGGYKPLKLKRKYPKAKYSDLIHISYHLWDKILSDIKKDPENFFLYSGLGWRFIWFLGSYDFKEPINLNKILEDYDRFKKDPEQRRLSLKFWELLLYGLENTKNYIGIKNFEEILNDYQRILNHA